MLRILICSLVPVALFAQTKPFDTVLYGASYYHEYMPYELVSLSTWYPMIAGLCA